MMNTATKAFGLLFAALVALLIHAPSATASPDAASPDPDAEFCSAMTNVGYTGDCTSLVNLARGVCAQYDRGLDWETVVANVDAVTADESLSNYVLAGAPMYFCPEYAGKI